MEKKSGLTAARHELIEQIEKTAEIPIAVLGVVWLVLLIVEMTNGLSRSLRILSAVIWVIFIMDFALRFFIAPDKKAYLKREWLVGLSLFVPAIRLIRILRVVRILGVVQGTSIVTMIGTVNRSMRSFNATLRRRGFIYIVLLTLVVILVGAAGMYAFERNQPGSFNSYGDAIWWTTMLLITIGSQYWPHTPAGKTLSVFISIYGFSVLGYITATLASFFVGRDAERTDGPVAGTDDIAKLREQIAALSKLIEEQNGRNDTSKEHE